MRFAMIFAGLSALLSIAAGSMIGTAVAGSEKIGLIGAGITVNIGHAVALLVLATALAVKPHRLARLAIYGFAGGSTVFAIGLYIHSMTNCYASLIAATFGAFLLVVSWAALGQGKPDRPRRLVTWISRPA